MYEGFTEQLNKWRREVSGEGAYLLDPDTGKMLDPRKPHQMLLDDGRLRSGYEYWSYGQNDLTIYNIRHSEADDLGTDGRFEKLMAQCSLYGFEGIELRQAQMVDLAALVSKPHDSFGRRWLATAMKLGKLIVPYDIEDVNRKPENAYYDLGEAMGKLYQLGKSDRKVHKALVDITCIETAFREWYMVCRLGYEVLRRAHGLEVNENSAIPVLISIGSGHRDLARKFRVAGVTVKSETSDQHKLTPKQIEYFDLLERAVASSVIPKELYER